VSRIAFVTQPGIDISLESEIPSSVHFLPDGEEAKKLSVIGELCSAFASNGLTRKDLVVGIGGGVVTDVAGFAASVYHRGIQVMHVPTTLLGQIDAAIGGKTGVNIPEGKNLVGAFWQPSAVICDTDALTSLPKREFRSGMGELAKYHFLGGEGLDELSLEERVAACIQIKADIVAADEREGASRALLNYGHTLAHALEIEGRFDLRHGEAVAIGIQYAALVAYALGRISEARLLEHERVLDLYELPRSLPEGCDIDRVMELFSRDKKAMNGLTFVLDGPKGLSVVPGVPKNTLRDVLTQM
jgi:5-deoxy-5-amino-3-dehydroquinate synthase